MILIHVDLQNPGQFFACCGIFELVRRIERSASAMFVSTPGLSPDHFVVDCKQDLKVLLKYLTGLTLVQIDPNDVRSSPIRIDGPFGITLDWWQDRDTGGDDLKTWAGGMPGVKIARSMLAAMGNDRFQSETILDEGMVVFREDKPKQTVEPYFFDSRRQANSNTVDVGWSPNDQNFDTIAHPAVEFFCLVGIQRFRPARTEQRRLFEYTAWERSLPISIAAAVVGGTVPIPERKVFRFENWPRTSEKQHKVFKCATRVA